VLVRGGKGCWAVVAVTTGVRACVVTGLAGDAVGGTKGGGVTGGCVGTVSDLAVVVGGVINGGGVAGA